MSYHSDLLPEKRQQRGRNSAQPARASSNYGCQGYVWGINQIGCRRAFHEGHYQCHIQQSLEEEQYLGSGGQGKVCQDAMPLKEVGGGKGLFWHVLTYPGLEVCRQGAVLGLPRTSAHSVLASASAARVLRRAPALLQ